MHLMAIEAEETSIPVEWVDADEWEVIEQAFATATSHSARYGAAALVYRAGFYAWVCCPDQNITLLGCVVLWICLGASHANFFSQRLMI